MKIDWGNQFPEDRSIFTTVAILYAIGGVFYAANCGQSFWRGYLLWWVPVAGIVGFIAGLCLFLLLVNLVDAILHWIFKD